MKTLACAAVLAVGGCGGENGKLTIRTTKAPPSAGAQPVPVRLAEGNAQLAVGNVALAIETYRKALRDDPRSVAALAGLAASYDKMGRFDLSRRHYEAALAVEPANTQVLTALAGSLEQQGKREEAAEVRLEIAQRLAAAATPAPVAVAEAALPPQAFAMPEPGIRTTALISVADVAAPAASAIFAPDEAPPAPAVLAPAVVPAVPVAVAAQSVTMKLPPARPATKVAVPAPVAAPVAVEQPSTTAVAAAPTPTRSGARLERLSMGEVALVTSKGPQWRPTMVASSARSATIRFVPLRQASARPIGIRLLNAARIDGLAARTRTALAGRGWRNIAIGNASATRPSSLVLYPAAARATAKRLAAQFGFPMMRTNARQVTVLLGRDAARKRPVA